MPLRGWGIPLGIAIHTGGCPLKRSDQKDSATLSLRKAKNNVQTKPFSAPGVRAFVCVRDDRECAGTVRLQNAGCSSAEREYAGMRLRSCTEPKGRSSSCASRETVCGG